MRGSDHDGDSPLRSVLAAAAHRVRHPAAPLAHFVADSDQLPEDFGGDGDGCEDLDLPPAALEEARQRRAALVVAATGIIDRSIDDLRELDFGDDGLPDPDQAEESFVFERFPARHRASYDEPFFRNVLVTVVKVAQDLAHPNGEPAACTAEEIVRDAVIDEALGLCEAAGLGQPWLHPSETLLEDTDFAYLFAADMDGIEDDPALQAGLGAHIPTVHDWFTPFNPDRTVHPYTETAPSGSNEAHDLRIRLRGRPDEPEDDSLADTVIDAPARLAGIDAASQVVALARRAAERHDPDLWIADPSDPEQSFAALVQAATRSEAGSGWLCWEPHQHADTIRTDPVVALHPHRHFPIGPDTPWVDAAIGTGHYLAVPLTCVVSYRPDPAVRHRWNAAARNLLHRDDQ